MYTLANEDARQVRRALERALEELDTVYTKEDLSNYIGPDESLLQELYYSIDILADGNREEADFDDSEWFDDMDDYDSGLEEDEDYYDEI